MIIGSGLGILTGQGVKKGMYVILARIALVRMFNE